MWDRPVYRPMILFFLLLPAFVVPGCLEEPGAPVRAITATYVDAEGRSKALSLGPPQEVVDADGTPRLAYPFDIYAPGFESTERMKIYVDAKLRPAVFMLPCGEFVDGECIRTVMDWGYQGGLVAYGLGLRDNPAEVRVHERVYPIDVSTKLHDGLVLYSVRGLPTVEEGGHHGAGRLVEGEYAFGKDPLPVSMVIHYDRSEPTIHVRTGYQDDGAIDHADRWPLDGPRPLPPLPSGPLYPGDHVPLFGMAHAPATVFEKAKSASSELRSELRTSCIGVVNVRPPEPPREALPVIGYDRHATARIEVKTLRDGKATTWSLRIEDGSAGESVIVDRGETRDHPVDCSFRNAVPAPAVDAAAFFQAVEDLDLRKDATTDFTVLLDKDPSRIRDPSLGGWQYVVWQRPAAFPLPTEPGVISYMPYILRLNANEGKMVRAEMHPSDIQRFMDWFECGMCS